MFPSYSSSRKKCIGNNLTPDNDAHVYGLLLAHSIKDTHGHIQTHMDNKTYRFNQPNKRLSKNPLKSSYVDEFHILLFVPGMYLGRWSGPVFSHTLTLQDQWYLLYFLFLAVCKWCHRNPLPSSPFISFHPLFFFFFSSSFFLFFLLLFSFLLSSDLILSHLTSYPLLFCSLPFTSLLSSSLLPVCKLAPRDHPLNTTLNTIHWTVLSIHQSTQ